MRSLKITKAVAFYNNNLQRYFLSDVLYILGVNKTIECIACYEQAYSLFNRILDSILRNISCTVLTDVWPLQPPLCIPLMLVYSCTINDHSNY